MVSDWNTLTLEREKQGCVIGIAEGVAVLHKVAGEDVTEIAKLSKLFQGVGRLSHEMFRGRVCV